MRKVKYDLEYHLKGLDTHSEEMDEDYDSDATPTNSPPMLASAVRSKQDLTNYPSSKTSGFYEDINMGRFSSMSNFSTYSDSSLSWGEDNFEGEATRQVSVLFEQLDGLLYKENNEAMDVFPSYPVVPLPHAKRISRKSEMVRKLSLADEIMASQSTNEMSDNLRSTDYSSSDVSPRRGRKKKSKATMHSKKESNSKPKATVRFDSSSEASLGSDSDDDVVWQTLSSNKDKKYIDSERKQKSHGHQKMAKKLSTIVERTPTNNSKKHYVKKKFNFKNRSFENVSTEQHRRNKYFTDGDTDSDSSFDDNFVRNKKTKNIKQSQAKVNVPNNNNSSKNNEQNIIKGKNMVNSAHEPNSSHSFKLNTKITSSISNESLDSNKSSGSSVDFSDSREENQVENNSIDMKLDNYSSSKSHAINELDSVKLAGGIYAMGFAMPDSQATSPLLLPTPATPPGVPLQPTPLMRQESAYWSNRFPHFRVRGHGVDTDKLRIMEQFAFPQQPTMDEDYENLPEDDRASYEEVIVKDGYYDPQSCKLCLIGQYCPPVKSSASDLWTNEDDSNKHEGSSRGRREGAAEGAERGRAGPAPRQLLSGTTDPAVLKEHVLLLLFDSLWPQVINIVGGLVHRYTCHLLSSVVNKALSEDNTTTRRPSILDRNPAAMEQLAATLNRRPSLLGNRRGSSRPGGRGLSRRAESAAPQLPARRLSYGWQQPSAAAPPRSSAPRRPATTSNAPRKSSGGRGRRSGASRSRSGQRPQPPQSGGSEDDRPYDTLSDTGSEGEPAPGEGGGQRLSVPSEGELRQRLHLSRLSTARALMQLPRAAVSPLGGRRAATVVSLPSLAARGSRPVSSVSSLPTARARALSSARLSSVSTLELPDDPSPPLSGAASPPFPPSLFLPPISASLVAPVGGRRAPSPPPPPPRHRPRPPRPGHPASRAAMARRNSDTMATKAAAASNNNNAVKALPSLR